MSHTHSEAVDLQVAIPAGNRTLAGDLSMPADPSGLILFAHGSGSSRLSPRNRAVADVLYGSGFATLLFDLLTEAESRDRRLVFDVQLLADRLRTATEWCRKTNEVSGLAQGYFGASTGAGAALVAAAGDPAIRAVVSRGGRPDLAGNFLPRVAAPTLLIVGGNDTEVIELNDAALARLQCVKSLAIVPGASHLFEERGTLEEAARLACGWFIQYLRKLPS